MSVPTLPNPTRAARTARADGDATRLHMIETAGQLFAERGYADTTSKAICARAQANMAAVNYHFGSREGLYLAVLKEVQHRLMSMAFLNQLASQPWPAEQKLVVFLEGLITSVIDRQNWHTRLWAREVLSPSPLLSQLMREETLPKFDVLSMIVGEITGLSSADPALTPCVLNVVAPCLVLLVIDREIETPIQSLFQRSPAELARHITAFALAGLRAVGAAQTAVLPDKA